MATKTLTNFTRTSLSTWEIIISFSPYTSVHLPAQLNIVSMGCGIFQDQQWRGWGGDTNTNTWWDAYILQNGADDEISLLSQFGVGADSGFVQHTSGNSNMEGNYCGEREDLTHAVNSKGLNLSVWDVSPCWSISSTFSLMTLQLPGVTLPGLIRTMSILPWPGGPIASLPECCPSLSTARQY